MKSSSIRGIFCPFPSSQHSTNSIVSYRPYQPFQLKRIGLSPTNTHTLMRRVYIALRITMGRSGLATMRHRRKVIELRITNVKHTKHFAWNYYEWRPKRGGSDLHFFVRQSCWLLFLPFNASMRISIIRRDNTGQIVFITIYGEYRHSYLRPRRSYITLSHHVKTAFNSVESLYQWIFRKHKVGFSPQRTCILGIFHHSFCFSQYGGHKNKTGTFIPILTGCARLGRDDYVAKTLNSTLALPIRWD